MGEMADLAIEQAETWEPERLDYRMGLDSMYHPECFEEYEECCYQRSNALELQYSRALREDKWITANGREIPITEMATSHVFNTINWLKKNDWPLKEEFIERLQEEYQLRLEARKNPKGIQAKVRRKVEMTLLARSNRSIWGKK